MSVARDKGRTARVVAIATVTILALALRLFHLGHENLWIDEVYQVGVASQPVATIISNYRPSAPYYTRDQAPLSMIVGHFFVGECHQEWMPRLPSALLGTLEILTFFLAASHLVAFETALLASVLLALSPLHLWYSQEVRWYAQWTFLSTLSYLMLLRAARRDSAASWAVYGLTRLASLYTFMLSVFVAAAQAVTLLWRAVADDERRRERAVDKPSLRAAATWGRWRALRWFVVTHLLVAAAGAPVLWMAVRLSGHGSGTPRASSMLEILYTAYAYAAGLTVGPTLAFLHTTPPLAEVLIGHPIVPVVAVVFGASLLSGAAALLRRPDAGSVILPWLLVPPALVFLLGALTDITYQVRYTLASLPAFYLVVAVGLSSVKPRFLGRIAVAAALACTVYAAGSYYYDPRFDKENVDGALAYVAERGAAEAQVVAIGQIGLAVEYYAGARGMTVVYGCGDTVSDRRGPGVAATADLTREIWMASGRDWSDRTAGCLERLSATHAPAEHSSFTGVELWHLIPRSPTATADSPRADLGSTPGCGGGTDADCAGE